MRILRVVDLSVPVGEGTVVHPVIGPREPVTWDHVAPVASSLGPDPIALGRTDWSRRYGQPDDDHPGERPPVHHLVAEVGGVIGETLRNLDQVEWEDPFVACLPIALECAGGGPVRAVAVEMNT